VTLALVTGAPGWLGTQLVKAIVHGLPEVDALREPSDRVVRCLVQRGMDGSPLRAIGPRVEIVEGDVTDAASLEPFFAGAEGATLFHAAAIIHPTQGAGQFTRVNAQGTRNVVDAAVRAKVRRMVHVSSNSPIGTNARAEDVFDENAPYAPYMGYGKSKMQAELAVKEAQARGDIEAAIIRPPWFYGPGQPPRQSLFFEMIRDGKAPIVGGGENKRSMAYVDNICQGLLRAASTPSASGQTYWIADERPYSINEIVSTVEEVLEEELGVARPARRLQLPSLVGDVATAVDGALQAVGFYQQKIHVLGEMNKTIACSIGRARAELGYEPRIALREGMRRSIRWCIEYGYQI